MRTQNILERNTGLYFPACVFAAVTSTGAGELVGGERYSPLLL